MEQENGAVLEENLDCVCELDETEQLEKELQTEIAAIKQSVEKLGQSYREAGQQVKARYETIGKQLKASCAALSEETAALLGDAEVQPRQRRKPADRQNAPRRRNR